MDRTKALGLIRQNIDAHGLHIYIVSGAPLPRYAYTIGLLDVLGCELILAGAVQYSANDVQLILNTIGKIASAHRGLDPSYTVHGLGEFSVRPAHGSWTQAMLLGALDYYGVPEMAARQIVPDAKHSTLDVPNLEREWDADAEPVWQWLEKEWTYSAPRGSTATTNLDALRGSPITEATRWEEDYWEMFAGPGPEVPPDELVVVPLGSLLASDASLLPVTSLEVGNGIWRDGAGSDWNPWVRRSAN